MAEVKQTEANQRLQAAFYAVLAYVETYRKPTETEAEQIAFFQSFLRAYPIRRTKRPKGKGRLVYGAVHNAETFRDCLRYAIAIHSRNKPAPKTFEGAMRHFFSSKMLTFDSQYTRKCQSASEKRPTGSASDGTCGKGGSIPSKQQLKTTHRISSPARSESSSCTILEEHVPSMWKELQGSRGPRNLKRKTSLASSNDSKIPRERTIPSVSDGRQRKVDSTSELPAAQVLLPRARDSLNIAQSRNGDQVPPLFKGVQPKIANCNAASRRSGNIDRRFIAAQMEDAEALYDQFRMWLGDGRDDQASFIAQPSASLVRLYIATFGVDWRVNFARLQEQQLAENADVLYALTGATLYESIFQAPFYEDEGRQETLCKKEAMDSDPGQGFEATMAQRLCANLNEHMKYQPPRASRPDGFVSKDLESELSRVFEKAVELKLAVGDEVAFHWHRPFETFSVSGMRSNQSHTPTADQSSKVALCFLPGIEKIGKQGKRPLYKAMVKAADIT